MLRLRLLVIGLFMLTWLAGASAETSPATEASLGSWRQTSQGWQRCEVFLTAPIEYRHPAIHPLVVGGMEIILTVTAMLVFSEPPRGTRETRT